MKNILTTTVEKKILNEKLKTLVDPIFKHNAGKTKEIFNKEHPYFDVPDEFKDFAKTNFGLPIPSIDDEK